MSCICSQCSIIAISVVCIALPCSCICSQCSMMVKSFVCKALVNTISQGNINVTCAINEALLVYLQCNFIVISVSLAGVISTVSLAAM